MRILILNHNLARGGGTFQRASNFARELSRLGHAVKLVSISRDLRWGFRVNRNDGYFLIESPDWLWGIGRTGWDPFDTLWRSVRLLTQPFDLVHALDSRPVVILPALAVSRAQRIPLVMDWADWWGRGGTIRERPYGVAGRLFEPIETLFEEAFRTRAAVTTVISAALERRAERLGVPRNRIWRIPNGCDAVGVPQLPELEARRRLGIPAEVHLAGHLGALLRTDATLLYDAFGLVADRDPLARLALIGGHRSVIPQSLAATGRVMAPGFVSRDMLPCWLAACDALLLPLCSTRANWGRWPGRGNDYLSSGRPIVATRVSDFAHVLGSAQAGILTDPSPAAFASSIEAVFANPGLGAQWGANGRRLAEESLSWSRLAVQLEAAYRAALDETPPKVG